MSAGWRGGEIRVAGVGRAVAVVFVSMFNPTSGAKTSAEAVGSKGLEKAKFGGPIDEKNQQLDDPNEVIFCKSV
jgi:hypothetical protein